MARSIHLIDNVLLDTRIHILDKYSLHMFSYKSHNSQDKDEIVFFLKRFESHRRPESNPTADVHACCFLALQVADPFIWRVLPY